MFSLKGCKHILNNCQKIDFLVHQIACILQEVYGFDKIEAEKLARRKYEQIRIEVWESSDSAVTLLDKYKRKLLRGNI